MAKNKEQEIVYVARGELDEALTAAIDDILSAEQEAKRIIAEAEQEIAAIRAESSAKERELREKYNAENAAARDKLVDDAAKRAEKDVASKMQTALSEGDKLVAEKKALITKQIAKLYSELGGK